MQNLQFDIFAHLFFTSNVTKKKHRDKVHAICCFVLVIQITSYLFAYMHIAMNGTATLLNCNIHEQIAREMI